MNDEIIRRMRSFALVALACGAAAASGASLHQWPQRFMRELSTDKTMRRMVARHSASMMRWSAFDSVGAGDPVISPVNFGADPTGVADSTAAFEAVTQALLNRTSGNTVLDNGIADLQGATVDLGGGAYLLSKPFKIPSFVGNMRVIHGSLRASASFPTSGYLIQVGDTTGCTNDQGSCNVNIGLAGLSFDGSQIAAGCVYIGDTMGAVYGPQNYAVNFTTVGLNVTGGHEVMAVQSWFGEYLYSDKRKENGTASTAIGIQFNGNDHIANDIIVYSSKIGIHVNGAANFITGIHTWNLATGNGGTGILVSAPQVRVTSCYLDWNDLVVADPGLFTVMDSFFLCGGRIVLKAVSTGAVTGFYAAGNQFHKWVLVSPEYASSNPLKTLVIVNHVSSIKTLLTLLLSTNSAATTAPIRASLPL